MPVGLYRCQFKCILVVIYMYTLIKCTCIIFLYMYLENYT